MQPLAPIGSSFSWMSVLSDLDMAARTNENVLLLGETGVGKGYLAHLLHERSARSKKPFVALNLAAVTPSLLEARLRGTSKGAYTGAIKDFAGVFEQADGGTLFLDEVAEAAPEIQVTLNDILDSCCVTRIGETGSRSLDVRVVAATNVAIDPQQPGKMRSDLYYRLATHLIRVPPLRDRDHDALLLAKHFASRRAFTQPALVAIELYDWPGNVRELQHAIAYALARAGTAPIDLEHLPGEIRDRFGPRLVDVAVDLARRTGSVSRRELVQRLSVKTSTAMRALASGVVDGRLRREGSGRAVHYVAIPWVVEGEIALGNRASPVSVSKVARGGRQ